MAMALVGYFGSMVAALAALMMLLNTIFASSPLEKMKPQHHPRPEFVQTIGPVKKPEQQSGPSIFHGTADVADTANPQDARTSMVARAEAANIKRRKVARYQRRKMLARDRDERAHTAALGYDQEPAYGRAFGPFGPGRF